MRLDVVSVVNPRGAQPVAVKWSEKKHQRTQGNGRSTRQRKEVREEGGGELPRNNKEPIMEMREYENSRYSDACSR